MVALSSDRRRSSGSRGAPDATGATRARPSTPPSATTPAPRNGSRSGARTGPVEFVPPDGVLPGQVGTLVDEHANLVDVTATIVDLAVRGWLTITDLGADNDYELTATQVAGKGTLLPYETELMNALFGSRPDVKLSDLKYNSAPSWR